MGASEKVVWAFLIFVLLVVIAVIAHLGATVSALATVGALILDIFYGVTI